MTRNNAVKIVCAEEGLKKQTQVYNVREIFKCIENQEAKFLAGLAPESILGVLAAGAGKKAIKLRKKKKK